MILLVISSSLMYEAENEAQPEAFAINSRRPCGGALSPWPRWATEICFR